MFLLTLLITLDPVRGDLLEDLLRKHGDTLYSIAYNLLKIHGKESREDAEDMIQDTFLKIYRHIDRFYGISEEETIRLLVIYTKNTVKDFLKKAEHRYSRVSLYCDDPADDTSFELPDSAPTPEEVLLDEESARQFAEILDALKEDWRQILLLKYQYGYKNKEIAQVLGISESNVSARLNRAKSAFAKLWEDKKHDE